MSDVNITGNIQTVTASGSTTPAVTITSTVSPGTTVQGQLSTGGVVRDHTQLSNIGANTHAQIDTALTRLANTSGTNTGDQDLSGYSATSHTHLLAAGATDVTATAAELNTLDGITASTTELNYTDGVTSAIQTQIDTKTTGAASSVDNEVALFDGTTGKLLQSGGANAMTVDPANGNATITGTFNLPNQINLSGAWTQFQAQAGDMIFKALLNSKVVKFEVDDREIIAASYSQVDINQNLDVTGTGTFSGDVSVPDEAYDATTWNGSLEVPTKNAIRDKIEAIELNDGDVVGPASATDNAAVRFDLTTGKLVQNSSVLIGDAGGISTTIASAGNAINLTAIQSDTTNNPVVVDLTQNANNHALNIVTGATTGGANVTSGFRVEAGSQTSGAVTYVRSASTSYAAGTNRAIGIYEAAGQGSAIDVMLLRTVSTGRALYVDKDVTNRNSTSNGIQIDNTSVVTDAGTYTKTGAALSITSNVTETSGTITDSAIVLDINQTHADATGNVVDISNAGSGASLRVTHTNTSDTVPVDIQATGALALNAGNINGLLRVYMNNASSSGPAQYNYHKGNGPALQTLNNALTDATAVEFRVDNASFAASTGNVNGLLRVYVDNTSATGVAQTIYNKGTGSSLYIFANNAASGNQININNDGTGRSINVDHDGSSASSITGFLIDVDNASTGGAIAVDIASASATSGTVIGQRIAAPTGGTANYALQLSDTGGTAAGGVTFGTDSQIWRSAATIIQSNSTLSIPSAKAINFEGTSSTNWQMARNLLSGSGALMGTNKLQVKIPDATNESFQVVTGTVTIFEVGNRTSSGNPQGYMHGGFTVDGGTLTTFASTTAKASLNIPATGVAPTTPNNGDIWFDGTNLKIQIGGVTKTFTVT